VPSCPHLFANASDASARRCALAVFEAGQPDSELEPSRGSQKKPSLVLRPLGPFVVALSAVRDKDSADPPCAFGHRAAHRCRSGRWAMRRVIFGVLLVHPCPLACFLAPSSLLALGCRRFFFHLAQPSSFSSTLRR
jgi:hypothetical protein